MCDVESNCGIAEKEDELNDGEENLSHLLLQPMVWFGVCLRVDLIHTHTHTHTHTHKHRTTHAPVGTHLSQIYLTAQSNHSPTSAT